MCCECFEDLRLIQRIMSRPTHVFSPILHILILIIMFKMCAINDEDDNDDDID